MSLVSLKCPSCSGDISLDDEKEFGYCSYCGCQIQNDAIKKLKIEYHGDPMATTTVNNDKSINSHNTTHNIYNIDNRETAKPNMTISKPKGGRLAGGIILLAIAAFFLLLLGVDNDISLYIGIICAVVGILLIVLYIRSMSMYSAALKNAIKNNSVTNRQ